jgi:hypothetical protein
VATKIILAAVLAAASAGSAAAQSAFGDTQLSYQNGVVYDDDLVPGRAPNASFLIEEQGGQDALLLDRDSSLGATDVRPNSENLIGADGRAVNARDR